MEKVSLQVKAITPMGEFLSKIFTEKDVEEIRNIMLIVENPGSVRYFKFGLAPEFDGDQRSVVLPGQLLQNSALVLDYDYEETEE